MHSDPAGQAFPQEPQLAGLLLRSTQVVPHFVWPLGHAISLQAPLMHCVPAPHTRPQEPQLLGSVLKLTQRPLQ
jgi:hypothetical protein